MQPAKDDKTHTIPLSEDSFFLKTILIIYSNPIVRNKNFFTDFLIISKLLYRPIFPVNLYPVIKKQTISSIKYRKKMKTKKTSSLCNEITPVRLHGYVKTFVTIALAPVQF